MDAEFELREGLDGNGTQWGGDEDPMQKRPVQALFGLLYLVIFTVGTCGNALVCFVVARNRSMQTVTNLFISNLALSDILLCALCVPFTPLYTFYGRWVFGSALCHTVAFAQGTSVYISTLTLTAIAVDRFYVIVHPFRPRMRASTCLAIVCAVWAASLAATLPYGVFMEHRLRAGSHFCEESWPSETVRQAFGGVTFAMQFVAPFLAISVCYTKIWLRLRHQARTKPGAKTSRKEEADRERKRRTNRMLVAMVVVFGTCWMPLNLVNLANDLYIPIGHWRYFNLCFFAVHALAMSSTCYNPFLYAWLNENFRKEFRRVVPCCMRAGRAPRQGFAGAGTSMGGQSVQTALQTSNSLLPDVVSTDSDPAPAPSPCAGYCANDEQVRFSGIENKVLDVSPSI
ncbi:prolactin-releasing peptide receptor-like [Schistocerca serialis cubense]|uniref:prolactin-releasing peptide receptor-like n=1 Tax=Schistocerca serialis cubense TaxID=2023355 RepID=UPI00214E6D10|nr:prolactin-releasing peptide receptor-like [Schistocerca serialis cubense]